MLNADFYHSFEGKYRGARDEIKERLEVYLPFVSSVASIFPGMPVVDIGCGRGEWLELLKSRGVTAHGVDLDGGMLSECSARGLDARQLDALDHLKSLPGSSVLTVTGFHIAEHLPFAALQALFFEASRVLVPGGLLILETPNPENLLVGSANFYIDPTHQRPLPSQLLTFLAEYQGFGRIKLLRLQELSRLRGGGEVGLYDVLANVSPDYGIIAQTRAGLIDVQNSNPLAVNALEQAFASQHGVTLETLASRYDERLIAMQAQLAESAREIIESRQEIKKSNARAEDALNQALSLGSRAEQLAVELKAVYESQSWAITRPFRWATGVIRSWLGRA